MARDNDAAFADAAVENAKQGVAALQTAKELGINHSRIYRALRKEGRFLEYLALVHRGVRNET